MSWKNFKLVVARRANLNEKSTKTKDENSDATTSSHKQKFRLAHANGNLSTYKLLDCCCCLFVCFHYALCAV